jgi:hypothetical protein
MNMRWTTVKNISENYGFIAEKVGRAYEITWNAPLGEQTYICYSLPTALVAIGALLSERDLDKQESKGRIRL